MPYWYTGSPQVFEAERERARRDLGAIGLASAGTGRLLAQYKKQRDDANALQDSIIEAETGLADQVPPSLQEHSASAQTDNAVEKGYSLSTANPDAVNTAEQAEDARGRQEEEVSRGLQGLGRYAQKFFAPFGLTDDPDIRDRSRRLAVLLGQREQEQRYNRALQSVGPFMAHAKDPAAAARTLQPRVLGRLKPGSIEAYHTADKQNELDRYVHLYGEERGLQEYNKVMTGRKAAGSSHVNVNVPKTFENKDTEDAYRMLKREGVRQGLGEKYEPSQKDIVELANTLRRGEDVVTKLQKMVAAAKGGAPLPTPGPVPAPSGANAAHPGEGHEGSAQPPAPKRKATLSGGKTVDLD